MARRGGSEARGPFVTDGFPKKSQKRSEFGVQECMFLGFVRNSLAILIQKAFREEKMSFLAVYDISGSSKNSDFSLRKINDFQGFQGSDIESSSCRIFLASGRPGGLKNHGF